MPGWQSRSPAGCQTGWLAKSLARRLSILKSSRLAASLERRLAAWQESRLPGRLSAWQAAGSLAGWQADRRQAGRLEGSLTGWQAGRQAGRLVG